MIRFEKKKQNLVLLENLLFAHTEHIPCKASLKNVMNSLTKFNGYDRPT